MTSKPHYSVYFTNFHNTLIFLDIRGNQYYAIEAEDSLRVLELLDLLSTPSVKNDRSQFAGYLKDVEKFGAEIPREMLARLAPRGDAQLPTRDAFGYRGSQAIRPTFRHLLRISAAFLKTRLLFPALPFEYHVKRIRSRRDSRRADHCPVDDALCREVEIFLQLRPIFYKARDHCLFDSLMLIDFLASANKFPRLVIGVRSNPFIAHAWVQADDCLLNDHFFTATHTKPILSI